MRAVLARAILARGRWRPALSCSRRPLSSQPSSGGAGQGATPHETKGNPPEDPFQKGLPLLFRTNASLWTLTSVLALVMGFQAYLDWSTPPETQHDGAAEEAHARLLPDGRMLMPDGSIRKRS